jgi:hypothetical protein
MSCELVWAVQVPAFRRQEVGSSETTDTYTVCQPIQRGITTLSFVLSHPPAWIYVASRQLFGNCCSQVIRPLSTKPFYSNYFLWLCLCSFHWLFTASVTGCSYHVTPDVRCGKLRSRNIFLPPCGVGFVPQLPPLVFCFLVLLFVHMFCLVPQLNRWLKCNTARLPTQFAFLDCKHQWIFPPENIEQLTRACLSHNVFVLCVICMSFFSVISRPDDRSSHFYERRDGDAYLRRPATTYHVADPLRGRTRDRLYRNGPYTSLLERWVG